MASSGSLVIKWAVPQNRHFKGLLGFIDLVVNRYSTFLSMVGDGDENTVFQCLRVALLLVMINAMTSLIR